MRYAQACEWLQLDPQASLNESVLKAAFRKAAIREHPDKSRADNASHRFQQITQAHQYLLQKCVAREDHPHHRHYNDDDDDDDSDDEDSYYYYDEDVEEMWEDLQQVFFTVHYGPHGQVFIRVHFASSSSRKTPSSSPSYPYTNTSSPTTLEQQEQEQFDENQRQRQQADEREYEEYMDRLYQYAREKEQARQRQKKRQEERAQQQQQPQRQRPEASLVGQWAHVTHTTHEELNGEKVRVVDYYNGMYVVEWDASLNDDSPANGNKTKIKHHPSRKARIKPEHLRLWKENDTKADSATLPQANTNKNPTHRMIKIKVKCPKHLQPGDVFEIKNPHNRGQMVQVRVPPNAEPGKSFPWMVPVAQEAPKLVVRCAVCARDLEKDNTAVALRSCPHSVCSTCLPMVENKCCFLCNKPRPTIQSFEHLPYLQELQAPTVVLEKLVEEYFCSKELLAAEENAGKMKEKLDQASEQATKTVNRHYRKMSIKLHPDRHGEEFRPQFELFTKAKDVMVDPKLRGLYIDAMLEIVCKVDLGYLPQSHQFWIQRNAPQHDEAHRRKKTQAGQKERNLQLDGGIMFNKPKKARVMVCQAQERLVEVALPVTNEYQFLAYCQEAIILGSCNDMEEDEVRLAQVSRGNLHVVDGEILVKVLLPKHSVWDIKWFIRVDQGDGRGTFNTPSSTEATVDLRSKKQIAATKEIKTLRELARRRRNGIQSTLQKTNGAVSRQEIESRYWDLHRAISSGRSLSKRLQSCLETVGESSTSELDFLYEILGVASTEKAKLEDLCEGYLKKDVRKNCKTKMAEFLEKGEAADWLASVTNDELVNLGADANRLYQLLIEGKKANSLALDGAALFVSSKRDIFSAKQREMLQKRGEELEEQSITEMNRVMEEERKADAAEKDRLEMEAMAGLMPRGTLVRIQGLNSQEELNGSIATYMGVGQNKRYIIRLFNGRDVALKESNFSQWDESKFGNADGDNGAEVDNSQKRQGSQRKKNQEKHGDTNKIQTASDAASSLDTDSELKKTLPSPAKQVPDSKQFHSQQHNDIVSGARPSEKAEEKSKKSGNQTIKARRCKRGAQCRFLCQGPDVCNFFHPPEEIARVHPPVKGNANRAKSPPTKHLPRPVQTPVAEKKTHTETAVATEKPSPSEGLFSFLVSQQHCFKCSAKSFNLWLKSEDITSLADLWEALDDPEYLVSVVDNGLKKFKSLAFKKAVKAAVAKASLKAVDHSME